MKQTLLLVLSLFVFNFTTAQNSVEASPSDNWTGYMNVFDLGGNYMFGSGWTVSDLQTVVDADGGTITLQPNFNAYNVDDAYWTNADGTGNKSMEASTFVEPGASYNGVDLTFSGTVSSNTLDDAYVASYFIKALDPAAGYADAFGGSKTFPLPASGEFSVTATAEELATGLIIQYGFNVVGVNANPADEAALGSVVVGNPVVSVPNVFFSEYAEGSSDNKYLEIYNASDETVDLTQFAYPSVGNAPSNAGTHEYWNEFDEGASVAPGEVYVIMHPDFAADYIEEADETHQYLSNGDDGYALVYGTEDDFVVVDVIGQSIYDADYDDPGSGWAVAGTNNATKDHVMVRKNTVTSGNGGDWAASAGTSPEDSEWVISDYDDSAANCTEESTSCESDNWTNLGSHEYGDSEPSTPMITFNVDPSSYAGYVDGTSVPHVVGNFGDNGSGGQNWNPGAHPMSDDDGDGIWSLTMALEDGDYLYKYTLGDWGTQEFWNCENTCLSWDGSYWNRALTVAGADQTLDFVHWNQCAGQDPAVNVTYTFEICATNIEVGANGMYIGGGVTGGADAIALTDDDGDGIWTGTYVATPNNIGGAFTILNSPNDGGDWGAKEDISGQDCAFGQYNDRLLPCVTEDTTITATFGDCSNASCEPVVEVNCTYEVAMVSGGSYPGEISWNITDASGAVVMSGDASSEAQMLEVAYGTYTLNMIDSYGDGWNGGIISVGGTEYTIEDGATGTADIVCEPFTCDYDVTMTDGGSWPAEISWSIADADGTVVLSGDADSAGLTLSVPEGAVYTLTLSDSYGDGWNGGILNIGGTEYTIDDGDTATFEITCTQESGVGSVEATVTGEYSGTATFDFMMSNFTVGVAGEGDGHIHYMINDGDAVMLYETSLTLSNLPDGTHTLTAMVVDDAHQPIEGALSASVEFTIATLACATEVSYDYGTGTGGGSTFDDNFTTGSASEIYSTTYNEGGSVTVNLGGTTENNFDWIYVTNGSGEVLLAPVSGTIDYQVTSDDGVLNVHLSSDGSVTSGPFTIETICGGLSTEDNNILDMTVYPNPVENGMVSILTPVDGEKFIELYSVTGRKVLETTIVGNTLDVSSITSGFYMLKVTVDGQSNVSKLVVR